jgi:hypothetical protein
MGFSKQEWGDNAPDGEMSTKKKQKSTNPAVIGQTEMDGGTIDR